MKSIENLTIDGYFSIFKRRIWYVVITAVLVASGTAVYTKGLPAIYRSEMTILVSERLLPADFIASLDRLTANDRIENVKRQLESRTVLERVVQEFQPAASAASVQVTAGILHNNMEFNPIEGNAFKIAYSAPDPGLAQAITRRFGELVIQLNDSSLKQNSQSADEFLEDQLRQASSDMFQKEQALAQFRAQHFAGSQAVSPEAVMQAQTDLTRTEGDLRELIARRDAVERRLEEQRQLKMVLGAPKPPAAPRPAAGAAPVASAETPATPQQAELTIKRKELYTASSRYTASHPDVTRLTREVKDLEILIAKSEAPRPAAPAASEPGAPAAGEPASPFTLSPEVETSLFGTAEAQADLDKLRRNVAAGERTVADLKGRLSLYQRQLNPSADIAQELATLQRNQEAAERTYKLLADKKVSSAMATRVDASDENETFKVLDPPFLPVVPIGPNRPVYIFGGCIAGLLLGLGLAFGREFLDPSLQDEAEAAAELRLPVFAGIPDVTSKLDRKSRKRLPLSIVQTEPDTEEAGKFYLRSADTKIRDVILDPLCSAGEPYRLMHTKLALMQKERGIKTILITSAVPNEGKTFAACCLAGVLARERGRKVLLIDADLRAGDAGRVLGLNSYPVGLVQLLGNAGFSGPAGAPGGEPLTVVVDPPDFVESLYRCADVDLHFLPSGSTPQAPSQLSNVSELERLIRHAEGIFDWIVIDSPPVLALSDANLLAPLCDATLFVVRSRKTNAAIVKDAIQRIGADKICGLLINRITGSSSNYYNSYYQKQSQRKLKA